jgi:hypothetical protein
LPRLVHDGDEDELMKHVELHAKEAVGFANSGGGLVFVDESAEQVAAA